MCDKIQFNVNIMLLQLSWPVSYSTHLTFLLSTDPCKIHIVFVVVYFLMKMRIIPPKIITPSNIKNHNAITILVKSPTMKIIHLIF